MYRTFWVTIVPANLATRLGGAAAMRDSGAFSDAEDLPGGSLWLRVTPTLEEFYSRDRARAVSEALDSVLAYGRASRTHQPPEAGPVTARPPDREIPRSGLGQLSGPATGTGFPAGCRRVGS